MGQGVDVAVAQLGRALKVASRVLCMLEGRIVLDAPASEVSRESVTAAYFGFRRDEGRAA